MEFSKKIFGTLSSGTDVFLYTLKAGDLTLSLSTLGAAWTSLLVPSGKHGVDDVLLGYAAFDGYVNNASFFGVTVGRFANRIRYAKFSLNGTEYSVSENKPGYSLHGGKMGFSRRVWNASPYETRDGVFIRFELDSPNGDQGYPGYLHAAVSYGLTKGNKLVAEYEAKVDALCPVNLTNHAYFNLAGEASGTNVLTSELMLNSSSYVEVDDSFLPTGKILPVEKTPLDFRARKPLGADIQPLLETSLGGYDHCFVIDGEPGVFRPFAELYEPSSGRRMKARTTQPGVQVYTGNMLNSVAGKIGSVYRKQDGLCLETQRFPDSPNQGSFPSAIFGPERDYYEKTVFTFDW
ncbi:MAG: aldose epimerase family protein [Christensenella sp.]